MKILFLCEGKLNVRNWSGTSWSLYKCLKKYFNVKVLEFSIPLFHRIINKVLRCSKMRKGDLLRRKGLIEWRKKLIEEALKEEKFDAIFSVGAIAAASIPKNINIPVYYYTDGTFAVMKNYYGNFSSWDEQSEQDAIYTEIWANKNVSLSGGKAFFSSEWAARSACEDYGL